MSVPPDQPTRQVPRAPATPGQPAVSAQTVGYVTDDTVWREQVLSRLDGVRTGLAVIGTLAVIALGLAVWALVREHQDRTDGNGGSARSAQIRGLRDDIDTLRAQIDNRATTGQLDALRKQVATTSAKGSATPAPDTTATDALGKSLSQLDQQVGDLGQRVKALEDSASSRTGTQTTGTQTTP